MYAVVVRVTIDDESTAETQLKENVVPRVSQAPGFVAGYWTRNENNGLSMIVFDSEDAARTAEQRVAEGVPEGVTLQGTEVREVVANA